MGQQGLELHQMVVVVVVVYCDVAPVVGVYCHIALVVGVKEMVVVWKVVVYVSLRHFQKRTLQIVAGGM